MGLYGKSLEKYIESYRNLNSIKHAYSALEKPCAIENLFGKRILQIHQTKYLVSFIYILRFCFNIYEYNHDTLRTMLTKVQSVSCNRRAIKDIWTSC